MEYVTKKVQTYQNGKLVTDQFYLDDDYNVPDSKSDIKRVMLGEGTLVVEEMKSVENYIRVAGKLHFRVLYVTDEVENRLASLEGRIPFEEMVYREEQLEEGVFLSHSSVELTVTMIHSRKLNIKALAEISLQGETSREQELTLDIDSEEAIYKKKEEQEILKLAAAKKDTCRIKEVVSIGGTKENMGTILWSEVTGRKLDTRLEQDELKLMGELLLFCFYESPYGKIDWVEQTIPYEGRIECEGAADHMYHQIYEELTDIHVEPRMDEDGEMRMIGVEATLEVRVAVYEEEKVSLLADLYSLRKNCIVETEEVELSRLLMQNHSKCKVSEELQLPEVKDNILQICHSSGRIQVERAEPVEGGIQMEGVLHVSFLYVKADDDVPFDTWQGMIPFSYLLESRETAEDMTYTVSHAVEQLSVNLLGGDRIEIKAVLAFHSFVKKPVVLHNMKEVRLEPLNWEEAEKGPGIIGYIVQEGDELWDLAKRYSTTVEGIKEVNELESDEIKAGKKILIFKENMSIL